ncbi:10886_t:CDS:2 [Paraglomus brasilianum]|uniref:10886_t:CDS:1 n=1 Tax=Paraglomus brasilianum TaxID=144538 RepID=A0A9N9BM12_9GLOM|nr:10886_t:CDS:2 [Paraglomus brasilianum]
MASLDYNSVIMVQNAGVSAKYRLCLKRPIYPCIHLNMWYTMDLMLVSEMGLFKKEDMKGIEGFTLSCKILNIGPEDYFNQLDVEVRSLCEEACEWSGLTNIEWAGICGDKGGLEFRVVAKNSVGDNELCSHHRRYLHVYPSAEVVHNPGSGGDPAEYTQRDIVDHRLVSLVIGPIELGQCYKYPSSCIHHQMFSNGFRDDATCIDDSLFNSSLECSSSRSSPSSFYSSPSPESLVSISTISNQSSWTSETYLVNNHRAFSLPHNKTLVIQELWDAGIPGKVWDSAFIVAQYMGDCFLKNESVLFGKRILDLSTGTGFVGLYLAALCGVMSNGKAVKEMKQTTVLLTDLEPAIDLIEKNQSLNHYLFKDVKVSTEIEVLSWGDVSKTRRLGPFDIVLASDVIYEPELFDALIQTFVTVCTPNQTHVYVGYKRRGLSPQEEEEFFLKLAEEFKVTVVEGIGKAAEEQKIKIYKLTR